MRPIRDEAYQTLFLDLRTGLISSRSDNVAVAIMDALWDDIREPLMRVMWQIDDGVLDQYVEGVRAASK